MPEIQPPSFASGECYTAQQDRMLWNTLICQEGTYAIFPAGPGTNTGPGSLAVIAGSGMQVISRSGRAFVQGDSVQDQGMYFIWNSSDVTLGVDASDPTDDRIDLVVAKVYDAEYEGSVSEWRIEVIKGSASPSPVAPALPPTALPLAEVRVRAGTTTISQSDITDLRQPYIQCAGHEAGQLEIGSGANLDTWIIPGTYTQSSSAQAASGSNYPPASALFSSELAGLLEVFQTSDGTKVWQRYTEYHPTLHVIWVRTYESSAGWGPWYPTGGPGDWTLGPVTNGPNVSGMSAIPGSTSRGVNRAGRIAVQFTWTGPDVTSDSASNFPDQLLFTITDPAYRPPRDTDVKIVRSGVEILWGRINASGDVFATNASFPNQKLLNGTTYRINDQWPPT